MTKLVNKQRGEVVIEGPDGKDLKMCLTLGAIAMLEDNLGIESLTEIDEVMKKAKMSNLLIIVKVLLAGGGNPVEDDQMITWALDFQVLMEKIRECFEAAGFKDGDTTEGDEDEGKA